MDSSKNSPSLTYTEAIKELTSALRFGIEPSLEGTRILLDLLGTPQRTFASIQVAGTNGKSSTARITSALLRGQGIKEGLYTSPELVSYPERIEVGGTVISNEGFAAALSAVFDVSSEAERRSKRPITEFEIITAAALHEFSQRKVDTAVLEVGLGGTWDATSVVDPAVSVITGVGLDHVAILGETLEEIAAEKAGIIKPACTPVLGPGTAVTPSVEKVFMDRAESMRTYPRAVRDMGTATPVDEGATVRYEVHGSDDWRMDVYGVHAAYLGLSMDGPRYQAVNIATAIAATEAFLGRALDVASLRSALMDLQIPGRFELVEPTTPVIIDGSHNPQAAEVLADEIERRSHARFAGRKPMVLLGMLADKDASGFVEAIAPVADVLSVTQPAADRALPAEDLSTIVHSITGAEPEVFASVAQAIEALVPVARENQVPLYVTGSIKTAGEAKAFFEDA